ncbi:MAG: 4-hydroxy-3-methylbut-2-enyl diphosphate reductase, partial [Pseudomonadota bacterium]
DGIGAVGVTAGASAPEVLVDGVVERLREWGAEPPETADGPEEPVVFAVPKELLQAEAARSGE